MSENAFVCWLEHSAPWEIEPALISEFRPLLNHAENSHYLFHQLVADSQAGEGPRPNRWRCRPTGSSFGPMRNHYWCSSGMK
jgi:hypothetical protein